MSSLKSVSPPQLSPGGEITSFGAGLTLHWELIVKKGNIHIVIETDHVMLVNQNDSYLTKNYTEASNCEQAKLSWICHNHL